jgi:ELWxxDGT repeat protein
VELWRSNGQLAGTVRVKNINPGLASSNPSYLFNHNSTLFFSAETAAAGRELWKSTGFGPSTGLVANIRAGAGSSNPSFLASAGPTLFFAATDGSHGVELWTLANPVAAPAQKVAPPSREPFSPGWLALRWDQFRVASDDGAFFATDGDDFESPDAVPTRHETIRYEEPWRGAGWAAFDVAVGQRARRNDRWRDTTDDESLPRDDVLPGNVILELAALDRVLAE